MNRKTFCFQIRLDSGEILPSARMDSLKAMVNASGGSIQDESLGSDNGDYINISVIADHPGRFWQGLQKLLQSSQDIGRSLIVVCEGDEGWEDYLLLHHFDKNEQLDLLDD